MQRRPSQNQENKSVSANGCSDCIKIASIALIFLTFPISVFFCIKIVQEYQRAIIFRLGKLISGGAQGPGLFFIIPCIDEYRIIDLRTVAIDVPPQEILTKDSVTVAVDAVVFYQIFDPIFSVINVEDASKATRLLAATSLRNELGTKNLSDILLRRKEVATKMQESLDQATDKWGIKVERVEVKDVRLPIQMQKSMGAIAEAEREAKAKIIMAEGEEKAALSIKKAADIIGDSSNALQLRYLQTLTSIAEDKNSTIVFPMPIDFLSSLFKK
ncbi:hypothetical protein A3Q56_00218 [Intoshia linei]|uniref:Band 7 domain-containing protein n=1 Tax=Intoshia linei TaxID=1819745 RepID=A0A177BEL7_9BILA|nr:hypothetical protein A3Q56_00218 [Intoshia linei]